MPALSSAELKNLHSKNAVTIRFVINSDGLDDLMEVIIHPSGALFS
jgi:hypothetical protein